MKKKIIIFGSLAVALTIGGVCGYHLLSTNNQDVNNNSNVNNENTNDNDLFFNIGDIPEENKYYLKTDFALTYEPTIDYLTENADLIVVGSFNKNIDSYVSGANIFTSTLIDVDKVIKNDTDLNITDNLTFERMGGVVTLEEYVDDNETVKPNEFADIDKDEMKNYYVIQDTEPIKTTSNAKSISQKNT